ncbi:MAG: acyltransferase family protein [Cyanobacteriota bacterium]|nr:acyltransferase family protein [Cyanobacteriota bacterium]
MTPVPQAKPTAQTAPFYRPEIDGLRAFAVVVVLIHHIDPHWLPGGFLGVDLFFVISGYVVTASLARRQETNWRQMLVGFYGRRFRRLLPAMVLMTILTAILFSIVVSPANETYSQSIRTGAAALIGVSNLYLLKAGSNYFDFGTQYNPFLHTWSLGVEEQFYLLWPILVMSCGVGFRGSGKRSLQVLLLLSLLLSLASSLFYAHLVQGALTAGAFYLMPARFWQLSAGALVFLVEELWPAARPSVFILRLQAVLNPLLGSLLMVGVFLPMEPAGQFRPVAVAATALLLASLRSGGPMGRWLSQPTILTVGKSSYSLYLWHWPLIVLLRWTIGIHLWTIPPLLASIAILTRLSYGVETTFRYGAVSGKGRQQPLVLYPLASLATAGFVLALDQLAAGRLYQGKSGIDPRNFSITRRVSGTTIDSASCFLEPTAPVEASQHSERCLAQINPKLPTLFLEGDSISHSLVPLLEPLHASGQFNVGFFARGGCPMPYMEPWAENRHRLPRYQACRGHGTSRQAWLLSKVRPGDQIILATTNYVLGPASEASYVSAISHLATQLEQRGAGLILVAPLPVFAERAAIKTPLSLCFPDWFHPTWAIPSECQPFDASRQDLRQATEPVRALQARLQGQHPNIRIFDPFPLLCAPSQQRCSTHRHGLMVFNDGIHLTLSGARLLVPQWRAFLERT